MTFQVGDRVEALCDYPQGNELIRIGWCGTVVIIDTSYPPIGVRWDDGDPRYGWEAGGNDFHDCHGSCESGYGWFVNVEDIYPLKEIASEDFDVTNDDIFAMIGGRV